MNQDSNNQKSSTFARDKEGKNPSKVHKRYLLQRDNKNVNHYISTFSTFKNHQWSKLNLELSKGRAPNTIKKMIRISEAQQEIKSMQHRLQTEEGYESIDVKDLFSPDFLTSPPEKLIESQIHQSKSPRFQQQNNEHEQKFKKFVRAEEAKQLKNELNQLNILQQIGSLSVIKEYKYPGSISEMVNFIKEKDLDLYERICQSRHIAANMSNFQGQTTVKEGEGRTRTNKEYVRLFTMNEREQVKVLKEWLEYMIEHVIKPEDPKSRQRLLNEQLLLAFTLSDLKDQLTIECQERGDIVDRVLALVFDMFKCYDLSFNSIVAEELKGIREEVKAEYVEKDLLFHSKELKYDKIIKDHGEIEKIVEQKENLIQSLRMENKAAMARFQLMRNLIDNMIFGYVKRLERSQGKCKEERALARDFVHELRELKRFSTKDEKELDGLEYLDEDGMKVPSLKRKVNKETQTINVRALAENKIKLSTSKYKTERIGKKKTSDNGEQIYEEIDGKETQAEKNEMGIIPEGSQRSTSRIGDGFESIKDQDDYSLQKSEEDSLTNQESREMHLQKEEQTLQKLEEYTPDQLLEYIQFFEEHQCKLVTITSVVLKVEQEVQTEQFEQVVVVEETADIVNDLMNQNDTPDSSQDITSSPSLVHKFTRDSFHQAPQVSLFKYNSQNNVLPQNSISPGPKLLNKSDLDEDSSPILYKQQSQLISNLQKQLSRADSSQFNLSPTNIQKFQRRGTVAIHPFQLQSTQINNSQPQNTLNPQPKSPQFHKQATMIGVSSAQNSGRQGPNGASIEDFFEEVQNLDLNDLDNLMNSQKQYRKKSMIFLQSLLGSLKKTKGFKQLVEKSVKEKLRDDEEKKKLKEEKWLQKNNGGQIQTPKRGKEEGKKMNRGRNDINHSQPITEEHSSSFSSSNLSETEKQIGASKFKQTSTKKKLQQQSSSQSRIGTNKSSSTKIPTKTLKSDKGIQVNFSLPTQQETQQQKPTQMTVEAPLRKPSLLDSIEPLQSTERNKTDESNARQDSRQRIKAMIHMVGKVSVAFGGNRNRTSTVLTAPVVATRTVPQPFSLGQDRGGNKQKQSSHPMSRFLPLFQEKLGQNDRTFLNVNPISVKSALKFMFQFYWDKAIAAKDSSYAKSQNMGEFMYDQLFNKYGIANITEKKLKEILMGIINNKSQNGPLLLFSKFLSIENEVQNCYSNDDLSFFYKLNKQLVLGDSFQVIVRKEFNLESPNIILQTAYDILTNQLNKKISVKTLTKLQEDFQVKVRDCKPPTLPTGQIILFSEKFYDFSIQMYREIKRQIFEQLKERHEEIITQELIYPQNCDKVFEFEEFSRLMQQLNSKGQLDNENIFGLFDANRIIVGSQVSSIKDEDKRITLESVLSLVFKYDLIII